MHGCSLSQLRASVSPAEEAGLLDEHVAEEQARQALLRERLGMSEAHAERTRRQMWTWDSLSLALCLGWQPFTANEVPARDSLVDLELHDQGEGRWLLDPWPFAEDVVRVHCEGRRLAGGYGDRAELLDAFAQARPVRLEYVLEAP